MNYTFFCNNAKKPSAVAVASRHSRVPASPLPCCAQLTIVNTRAKSGRTVKIFRSEEYKVTKTSSTQRNLCLSAEYGEGGC